MIPSVVATQLQESLVDYIQATLAFDDIDFSQAFTDHLRGPDGLFRGPFLRLGMPFATAPQLGGGPLAIGPDFKPYLHQLQSFQQLHSGGDTPARNTLVTTGTGSGKTECFLYPILDHCFRHIGQPGVKAILIYPMNALATDQARRLAGLIHDDPRLKGKVTAGLYVGGPDKGLPSRMGKDHLIESKQTQRSEPPDILLTNYKMLDFMLVRPDERKLWEQNAPTTLQYLVIDELHTFDGAQGSDVACLIRRLKKRLQTPEDHLICAGTSATIGNANDEATFERLAGFAREVFDERFEPEHVVREQRQDRATFLPPAKAGPLLPAVGDEVLDSASFSSIEAWLDAQQQAWLGEIRAPVELGSELKSHPFLNPLLAVASDRPSGWSAIDAALTGRVPDWGSQPESRRKLLLTSFVGLISHARRQDGPRVLPLLTVQVQLWCRELTRLLRALPDQTAGALKPPAFAWYSDIPSQEIDQLLYAPQAHCRECGVAGLAAAMPEKYKQQGRLLFTPSEVGTHWMESSRYARFVWPRPLQAERRPGELLHWLDPRTGILHGKVPLDDDDKPRGTLVCVESTLKKRGTRKRFAARCPACGADDALSIVGARAASLSSVAVTQLFQGASTTDKKLLAFTDSVQDACHRAGFFGGRTFRIHLRTAMQAVIAAHDPLPLHDAARAFEDHWRPRLGDFKYLAAFLPPDLRELQEFQDYANRGGKGRHVKLWSILRDRMAWEFTREFGVAAGYGRSLERSAASVAQVEPERFAAALSSFSAWLQEQPEAHPGARPEHFLRGLLRRLRQMGAVFHPFLQTYVKRDGKPFLLSKKQNPFMSPVGRFSKRIRFLASQARGDVFPCPFGKSGTAGWYGDWVKRALDWPSPGADELARVYGKALSALSEAGVLENRDALKGGRVWGLRPQALRLTCAVGAVQAGHRGRVYFMSKDAVTAVADGPAWPFRSQKRCSPVAPKAGFYAELYNRGETTRVFPGEHTGLLTRARRTQLETRFLTGATAADPHAPNMLVATPTLEMGVDIGDLSATMLCSVPPTPANYLQRIGRAGRKTGNAMVFVLATNQPHDLYFHAAPERMLDGAVRPPGVFLGAVSMLRRQLSAWCMDHWARDDDGAGPIPRKASLVLNEAGRARFPGRMLAYADEHRDRLLDGFLADFGEPLSSERRDVLRAWLQPGMNGMATAFHAAFDDQARQIKGYQRERDRAWTRIKKIEADPTAEANPEEVVRELRRYRHTLGQLIDQLRNTYPLNVLADASLLPNYAFPERGVKLHSQLGSDNPDYDAKNPDKSNRKKSRKRVYDKREYVRPAARALTELAPFSSFYAEGHKVQIRELDLGPKASRIEHWRFCRRCHHREPRVDPTQPSLHQVCPVCQDSQWADNKGQVLAMLPMNVVRSVADRVRSTTIDDSEERSRERFHVHKIFDIHNGEVEGEAVVLPKVGFGFEFLKRLPLTELNLGLKGLEHIGTKVVVAGETASAQGFPTCRDCGTVRDPRSAKATYGPPEHSPFCPQKRGDTKPREALFLFREVESEAVRFLLPISEMYVEERLYSFQAAIAYGLRRQFGGRPIHLSVSTMAEPDPKNPQVMKHYLVLFDTVPGGTGYLREYRNREAVFRLLEDTLYGLQTCSCRDAQQDGCYLCLFAHQLQRHLPSIQSSVAERILTEILANRTDIELVAGLSGTSMESVAESELEERFLAAMKLRFGDRWGKIDGGMRWELRLDGHSWQVQQQLDISSVAGQGMIADFVFECTTGPQLGERVVVECDGAAYHVLPDKPQGRVSTDLAKRTRVAQTTGWRVFNLVWHDLKGSESGLMGANLVPVALKEVSDKVWDGVMKRVMRRWPDAPRDSLQQLRQLTPFQLLCAYLEAPGEHWEQGVSGLLLGRLAGSLREKKVVGGSSLVPLRTHLEHGSPLSPLPPHAIGPVRGKAVGLLSLTGDLAILVEAMVPALQRFDLTAIDICLRLDDRHARRKDKGFEGSWRAALQALNYLWMAPRLEVFSDEALARSSTAEPADDFLLEVLDGDASLAAEPDNPVPYGSSQELTKALARCAGDERMEALLREVHAAGLPLPSSEDEELYGILPVLVWPVQQLTILDGEFAEDDDIRELRQHGWTALQTPVEPEHLLRALRGRLP